MKVEITIPEENIKQAQIDYLLNEGIIMNDWIVKQHYPTLGQIVFETDEQEEDVIEELSYREAKEGV